MRYVHTNQDGTIGLWSCVPLKARQGSVEVRIESLNRTAEHTTLAGHAFDTKDGKAFYQTIIIGDAGFDVADLEDGDWTFEYPDFELDIKAKLPAVQRDQIVGHRVGTKAEIPADYTFRAAWRDEGKNITYDMERCREITRDRLRRERAPLLAAKDIESIKALEAGDVTSLDEIAVEKQRLRDITALPSIDAAMTPEELKAVSVVKTAAAIRLR